MTRAPSADGWDACVTQSFGKHLRPRETEKRAREWTDVTECHARLCKRDITERKEAACEVRKALCISLSMQCTHMHTQMHTQRHVHTQHTQTHVCTHTRARTHPTRSSTSPSGAELDSAAGAAWGPPPLRFQAVLTIVSPQTREPGRITAFSESHIVTILYNENGTSQRHRLAGFKRANFRICQNRQEPVGPDCPARPGPGSRTPHPAPQCPRQQVGAAAATRLTRSQNTRRCWSGAGPGRTTELKPKCPRAVAVLMDQPSRTGTTAVPGRSRRARVCHFRRHLAQFPRRSHRPHGLWGCPGPASPSPASLRSLQRGSALAPAPETTPGGAQHRLSVQEQTRGPPVGPPAPAGPGQGAPDAMQLPKPALSPC